MARELEPHVIKRMQAGDSQAFRQILDHHFGSISAYVQRMIQHSAEAEDIVQETFVRLWTSRDRFDANRVKLSTWLHRIAHNLCIDSYRRNQHRIEVSEDTFQEGPQLEYEKAMESRQVRSALMELAERQRNAIVLCHYQGLPNKQAAEILGVSVDALESLLRRGRSKLKDRLAN
jgi:RNA polymerase sigma-70 factor (ECF subfamily)